MSSLKTIQQAMTRMMQNFIKPQAYRRAYRALRKTKRKAWYLCDLLEHQLKQGLITPAEVMNALRHLKTSLQRQADH